MGDTLLCRWPDRCDIYSEDGVIDTESLTGLGLWWPNLHSLHPTCGWITTLFSLQAAAAATTALGWRVKESLLLLWILYSSQNRRNPFVVSGGDKLLELLLMWAALMHYSMDNEDGGRRNYALSVAVAGHKAQIVIMYMAAGLHKYYAVTEDGVAVWRSGDALQQILMCCTYRKYWGGVLLQSPFLCRVLTWLTLVVELTAPVTLLCLRGRKRAICALAFMAMHVSMGVAMTLWNFSAICITALLPFIPPEHLPRFRSAGGTAAGRRRKPKGNRIWRCVRVGFWMSLSGVLSLATLLVTCDTLPGCRDRWGCLTSRDVTHPSRWYRSVAINLSMVQVWNMFHLPLTTCGSWRIRGESGAQEEDVYLLKHTASGSRDCAATQPSTMAWFALYEGLQLAHVTGKNGLKGYTSGQLARYYCKEYNLTTFELDYIPETAGGETILRIDCIKV